MKTITTIILLLLISGTAYSTTPGDNLQIPSITSGANLPRPGDKLEKLQVEPIPVRGCGDSLLWDLSRHKTGKKHMVRYLQAQNGQTIELENNSTKYYLLDGDTLRLTRQSQPGMSVSYPLPEPIIGYPMDYGTSMDGYFYGEGSLGNVKYIRNAGHTTHSIDSRGILVTPDGDTLRNVLRGHYSRTGTTYIAGDFSRSFSATHDSTLFSSDSICRWLATDSVIHRIDRWQWYARGYRYPVAQAETYKIYYFGTPVDSVKRYYYYRTVDQKYDLEDDHTNEQIRYNDSYRPWYADNSDTGPNNINNRGNSTKNSGGSTNYGKSPGQTQDNTGSGFPHNDMPPVSYPYATAFPTVVTGSTTINYGNAVAADIKIILNNTAGAVMWQHSGTYPAGDHSVSCHMEALPAGNYMVVTHIGNESFSIKLIKR